jgi:hypothetical protein
MSEPVTGENKGRVRLLYKIILYIAAALAALFAIGLGSWPLAYIFPLGLVAVFDRHLANDGGWGVLIGAWLVYIAHGYFYFRSRTTTQTQILYGILIFLLIANVSGCREMWSSH